MRRFPVGLTLAFVPAFAALAGLGTWQLQRLAWKSALITRIEALQHAPPQPIQVALARMAAGGDAAYTRVRVDCRIAPGPEPFVYRYALRDDGVAWRALSVCRLPADNSPGSPYDGVVLDRGLVSRLAGLMAPEAVALPPPVSASGILREVGGKPVFDTAAADRRGAVTSVRLIDQDTLAAIAALWGVRRPAPLLLAVESETPAPAGVTPAALPQDIPNNHFVYALTWYALAGILTWFYVALVWRRLGRR